MTVQGNYSVILADPPWNHYNGLNYRGRNRTRAREHYDTMPTDAICHLPLGLLAADDAALFMWACASKMPDAFAVMSAWGFRPTTIAFTWVKLNQDGSLFMSLGQYTRQNAELCLLGIKGSMRRKAKDVQQVILSRRREHSRKPDEQYERIMRLFDGPYIEAFGRQRWPGWDTWGNQANKFPAQPFLIGEQASA